MILKIMYARGLPKCSLQFFIRVYIKTQTNFLANPIIVVYTKTRIFTNLSASAVGAPKVLNFVSKNFRDINAREELLSCFPSGHSQEGENAVLEQILL